MKFSIVIPVYKVEKYLDQCVQSVLEQSFADFELIFVDDGSTDGSWEVIENLKKEQEKIEAELEQIEADLYGDAATDYKKAAELTARKDALEERLMEIYGELE